MRSTPAARRQVTPRAATAFSSLSGGLHAYRQLGVRRGTATAARHMADITRGRVRSFTLKRSPLHVTGAEVRAALGDREPAHALDAVADALPSVRRWAARLEGLDERERHRLLQRADAVRAHRFDLLGSGPTDLGATIDWHRDFKSGRTWPLEHFSRIRISYPDHSDIKVPWELSRFQHLPLLAAAHALSRDQDYLDEVGAQLCSWIEANPVEFGVNWGCTMDVAIRAANWVAALVLCGSAAGTEPWYESVLASLLLHARFIRTNLEFGSARGNHYLADVVGLLIVAGVFAGSDEGQGWARWATRELGREMRHQVRADGCDHEASTSYHRLVTEMFIIGADAADALAPGALDREVRPAIDRMLRFVADYTRPDGLAPQIGDADDGRLLPLGDYGAADQRDHLHLFRQADRPYRPATGSAAYPAGGFYVLRSGEMYAAVRCGDVGIRGRGCHAHNDLLAFELCWDGVPLVVDPGSYLYTADPVARNRFRSTAAHSALLVDAGEQNELRLDRLFAMVDRARAEALEFEAGTVTTFRGRHHGFETLPSPATHTRALRLDGARQTLEVIDEVESAAAHELCWSLPLAPCEVTATHDHVLADFGAVALHVHADGLSPTVDQGWLAPSYGVRIPTPVLRLRTRSEPGVHRTAIALHVK